MAIFSKRGTYNIISILDERIELLINIKKLIRNFIKKYFDNECLIIFEEAVKFNRKFVLNNPKEEFYKDFYKKFDNSI